VKGIAGTAFRRDRDGLAGLGSPLHFSGKREETVSAPAAPSLDARCTEREDDCQQRTWPGLSVHDDLGNAYALLADRFPEETFNRNLIVEGPKSRRLQAGLRAVLIAVLIVIAAQGIMSVEHTGDQAVHLTPQPLVTSN
jgi:hypothetical protein